MEPGYARILKQEKIQKARDGEINIFTLLYKGRNKETRMLIKHFVRFLISHNVYEIFIRNLLDEENITWLTYHMPFSNPAFIIETSFKWSTAIGGPTLWSALSTKWQRYANTYGNLRWKQCKELYEHGDTENENGLGIWYVGRIEES